MPFSRASHFPEKPTMPFTSLRSAQACVSPTLAARTRQRLPEALTLGAVLLLAACGLRLAIGCLLLAVGLWSIFLYS